MADGYLSIPRPDRKEIARIFSKITIDAKTGCWIWTAGRSHKYGKLKFRRRTELAHRFMYAWLVEPIPKGQGATVPQIDHIVCNRHLCCNPAHLALVLPRANILRSDNAASKNARKTHCKNGHPLPETRNRWDGGRECKICRKALHQSESYVEWNRAFGKAYHQARRWGPDREKFLAHQREVFRAWIARKRAKAVAHTSGHDPKP